MKLTPAQKQLLIEVSHGDDRCTPTYPPAARLVDLGLCYWQTEYRLALTATGRSSLSRNSGAK